MDVNIVDAKGAIQKTLELLQRLNLETRKEKYILENEEAKDQQQEEEQEGHLGKLRIVVAAIIDLEFVRILESVQSVPQ